VAVVGFIIGYLVGRPKRTMFTKDYDHGYDEKDERTHEGLNKQNTDTLSDEDRDYIS